MTMPMLYRVNFQPLFVNKIVEWQDYRSLMQAPLLQAQSYFNMDKPDSGAAN